MTRLRFVTITGADDATSIPAMLELSRQYERLEWGILLGSHIGPRFPSLAWVDALVESCIAHRRAGYSVNLSLHLCGRPLRMALSGDPFCLARDYHRLRAFGRFQLNFHGEPVVLVSKARGSWAFCSVLELLATSRGRNLPAEVIFQLDGINDRLCLNALDWDPMEGISFSGLVDASHGAGVLADNWVGVEGVGRQGFAGGLSATNVARELDRIDAAARAVGVDEFWIDAETRLRNEHGLLCLETCQEFVASAFAWEAGRLVEK